MTLAREHAERFTGSFPRSTADVETWHAKAQPEQILDPSQPIFDPHHHLYGGVGDRNYYTPDDLKRDLASGHRIVGTAYIEAYGAGWRTTGPQELRTVGEVEAIVAQTSTPWALPHGACHVAAGVIAFADLLLGDQVVPVFEALAAAGKGRLRGIRYRTAVTSGPVGRSIVNPPARHLLVNPDFQRGVAQLARHKLSFDAWVYDDQLAELTALADACPDTVFILDHVGGLVGVAESSQELDERRRRWISDLRTLAQRPNIMMKIGGLGMTMFGFGFEFLQAPPNSNQLAEAWREIFNISLDAFGAERCMFESNFPVDAQCASYATVWNAFKRLAQGLSDGERRALFYGTATKAYDLPAIAALCDQISAEEPPRPII
ncbi:amidohydrolase family protein [Sphingobium sp. H39-3-25]|uniref:amidohydrolase family protein n=1 Tax=Sphingobium arseniciresistens TaxID=3030834 RepID=UPI0023B95011|nr:amidohydrolase family protein [Sphingobium arseniciresistens]